MMKRLALLSLLTLGLAAPAFAEPVTLTVDFGHFPKGTTCQVFGTTGRVSLKTGKEIEYKIKGDTGNVSFRCMQPDGRRFDVATGSLLPQGNFKLVAMQINQDNHAHVFWDQGGLQRRTIPGILNWN